MKSTYDKRIDIINVECNMGKLKDRLKYLRKEKKITQTELSKETGINRSSIALWESGARIPNADQLKILSGYYNVTSDYLLGFAENKYEKVRADQVEKYRKNKHLIK